MAPDRFSLANYPWLADPSSREYQDMQVAIASAWSSQRQTLEKMLEIAVLSRTLIDQIERELEAKER